MLLLKTDETVASNCFKLCGCKATTQNIAQDKQDIQGHK